MAEFPALPLFTDAYLGDTTHLTTFEHGAYFLLLVVSWRAPGCQLPDDDALLARYARTTADKWRKIKPVIAPFFRVEDGFWRQARLRDEFRLLQSRKSQQIEAGYASAKAKALKRHDRVSTPVGLPLQREVNETSTPTPTPTPTLENMDSPCSTREGALPSKPDGVDDQIWRDFKRQRKKPLTATALTGIQRQADQAGWTLNQALAECCSRGWQGFKAEWIIEQIRRDGRAGNRSTGAGPGRSSDGFINAIRESRARREARDPNADDEGGMRRAAPLGHDDAH